MFIINFSHGKNYFKQILNKFWTNSVKSNWENSAKSQMEDSPQKHDDTIRSNFEIDVENFYELISTFYENSALKSDITNQHQNAICPIAKAVAKPLQQ